MSSISLQTIDIVQAASKGPLDYRACAARGGVLTSKESVQYAVERQVVNGHNLRVVLKMEVVRDAENDQY